MGHSHSKQQHTNHSLYHPQPQYDADATETAEPFGDKLKGSDIESDTEFDTDSDGYDEPKHADRASTLGPSYTPINNHGVRDRLRWRRYYNDYSFYNRRLKYDTSLDPLHLMPNRVSANQKSSQSSTMAGQQAVDEAENSTRPSIQVTSDDDPNTSSTTSKQDFANAKNSDRPSILVTSDEQPNTSSATSQPSSSTKHNQYSFYHRRLKYNEATEPLPEVRGKMKGSGQAKIDSQANNGLVGVYTSAIPKADHHGENNADPPPEHHNTDHGPEQNGQPSDGQGNHQGNADDAHGTNALGGESHDGTGAGGVGAVDHGAVDTGDDGDGIAI